MNESRDAKALNVMHAATYDAVATRYAEVNAAIPEAVLASARAFVKRLGPDRRVLELGCGHGRDAAWLAAQGLHVLGGDLSHGMLRQAWMRVPGRLTQLDMRRLPFLSRGFNGIWSSAAIIHLLKSDVPELLQEVRRVLVPGGIFFAAIQLGTGEVWEPQSYGQPVRRFFARYSAREFAGLMQAAGFQILSRDESNGGPVRHWAHYLAVRPV